MGPLATLAGRRTRGHAIHLAISPSTPGVSADDLVGLCVAAEEMGYQAAWLSEVAGPESFALAGAIASATSRLDLGIAVVAAASRSPALQAMGAGTISQLLGGRTLSLGIGSSSELIVEQWHGRSFVRPLTQVSESVEATRAALTGERSYSGATTSMSRFPLASEAAGDVELYVGALGPGMLRLAGAVGDGVCLNLMPPRVVARQLAEVREGAAAADRDVPEHYGVMARLHTVVTHDLAAGRRFIRSAFGPYFAQPVYNRFLAWSGYPEEAEAIETGFAQGDREAVAAALHDRVVDDVAMIGPVARIRELLDAYADAGLTVAALNVLANDAKAVHETLDALRPAAD